MVRIVVSELLCFLINNRQSFENLLFHSTVSEFYTHDEISAARKTIFGDFDTLKTENFKGTHSGNTKKEKVAEIVDLVKFIFDNKLEKRMPCYAAVNLNKVPDIKLMYLDNILDKKTKIIEDLLMKFTDKLQPAVTLPQDFSVKCMPSTIPEQSKISGSSKQKTKSQVSWADKVKENKEESLDENVPDFEVVQSRKQKTEKRTNKFRRIIGKMEDNDTLIKASKVFIRKKVCYLGNISPCSVDTIKKEHLNKINVNFISCYPVFKNTKSSGNLNPNLELKDDNDKIDSVDITRISDETLSPTDMSTSFRICISSEAMTNMFNPDNWPRYVVVREWSFKQNNK